MNISVISMGEAKAIVDHTEGNYLGYNFEADGVFVEDPLTPILWENKPYANTCVGVQNLLTNKVLYSAFMDNMAFEKTPNVSSVFAVFNGTEFSDFIEVTHSDRFMNGEVGPRLGFVHGTGLKLQGNPYDMLPQLLRVKKALTDIAYRGEVALGISQNYTITGIHFGHLYGHFALFAEICKCDVQGILEFIFGNVEKLELYDSIVIGNLITQPPFPSTVGTPSSPMQADKGAEKHLWRILLGGTTEVIIHTVHGTYVGEARKRLRRTIEKMLRYSDILQFRTDYGYGGKFVLMREQYEKLLNSPYRKEA